MTDTNDTHDVLRVTGDIVVAYLERATVSREHLADLVREVRIALESDCTANRAPRVDRAADPSQEIGEVDPPRSAGRVSVAESIHDDFLISFEDGKPYRSLKRHLMAKYGLTPEQYRTKWNLPPDYPMVAPSYAAERSAVAKRIGLGKASRKTAPRTRLRKG